MEHSADNYNQSLSATAQQVRVDAEAAAESMALSALTHCNTHFEKTMTEGAAIWVSQKCDPSAMAALGNTSAVLVQTGKRQALIEAISYLLIFGVVGGTGLWLISAPLWLFASGVPVSGAFALVLTLSGNDKD